MSNKDCWSFCYDILPDVSRSFALIIPMCPPPIDRALCVAYLLCRIADTVEDEPSLNDDLRAVLYDTFLQAVDEPVDIERIDAFVKTWPAVPDDACGKLINGCAHVLAAYRVLPDQCRPAIKKCVHDMVAGMRLMRPVERHNGVAFLCRDMDDLDQYCHYVAGTVGIMSTALFEARISKSDFTPTDQWREQGRRMGLGLQMTNIIKDCHVDASRGRSFIPASCVDKLHTSYRLSPTGRADLIRRAIGHLDAAMQYALAIPQQEKGIRSFLLGSILPAIATLEVAAPGTKDQPKISRAKMKDIFSWIDRHIADDDSLNAWYTAHCLRTLAIVGTSG